MISAAVLKKNVFGKKVLIDSNVIIYLTDAVEPYSALSKKLFQMIEFGDAEGVISVLSIAEVMQGPLKKGYYREAMEVRDYLMNFPNSHCQEITTEVIERVGNDERVDWGSLRTIDSLIVACGIVNDVDFCITNEKRLRKALSEKLLFPFDN